MIKVLIVDDSVIFRTGIAQALSDLSDIHVMGTASNGRIALMKIQAQQPDVIVLDLEMPEMEGMTLIQELKKLSLPISIIVFSDQSERGAKKALEALTAGADDFMSKSILQGAEDSVQLIRKELPPRIRQFLKAAPLVEAPPPPQPTPKRIVDRKLIKDKPRLILIACSTGGPEVVRKIFTQLRSYQGPHILIVEYMHI